MSTPNICFRGEIKKQYEFVDTVIIYSFVKQDFMDKSMV